MKALERRVGLRRGATRAPTQAPEWRGRLRPARENQTRSQTYCRQKMVLTTGATSPVSGTHWPIAEVSLSENDAKMRGIPTPWRTGYCRRFPPPPFSTMPNLKLLAQSVKADGQVIGKQTVAGRKASPPEDGCGDRTKSGPVHLSQTFPRPAVGPRGGLPPRPAADAKRHWHVLGPTQLPRSIHEHYGARHVAG
jgi:hypothetical protein